MPITSTTFINAKEMIVVDGWLRAYADVVVINPARTLQSPVLQCLVDTGSDYTILPEYIATLLGIELSGPPAEFTAAGGKPYSLPTHPAVDLLIQGYHLPALVAFSESDTFTPILGRGELLAAFDFGFGISSQSGTAYWYWG